MTEPPRSQEDELPSALSVIKGPTRFMALGIVGTLLAFAQMHLYVDRLGFPEIPSYAIAQAILLAFNFLGNRHWVFEAACGGAATQGLRYLCAVALFRSGEWCVFSAIQAAADLPYVLAILMALALVFPLKFLVYHRGIFRAQTA